MRGLKARLLVVRPHCTRRNPITRTTRTGKAIFPELARVWDLTCAPDVSGFSNLTFPQVSAFPIAGMPRSSSTTPKLERLRDKSRSSLGQKSLKFMAEAQLFERVKARNPGKGLPSCQKIAHVCDLMVLRRLTRQMPLTFPQFTGLLRFSLDS